MRTITLNNGSLNVDHVAEHGYCECGEELYETSDGVSLRCVICDDPDPSCFDGGGPAFDDEDDGDALASAGFGTDEDYGGYDD